MKKILLSITLLGSAVAASAQCTPDPSVNSGISPDTVTNMQVAWTGQSYNEVFTFVVPTDTTYNGFPVTIDDIVLMDVTGLPSQGNFDYACDISNCTFPGGSKHCANVFSTTNPTNSQIGSYSLTIVADAHVTNSMFGINNQSYYTLSGSYIEYDGYYLIIADGATQGIQQVGIGQMKSLIAYPNPTNGNTTVEFAMGYDTEVTFTVANLLGEVVNRQMLSAPRGLNRINFDASDLSNGIYLYTITDGKNTISKKLIVNK